MYKKGLIAFDGRGRRKKGALLPQRDLQDHRPVFAFLVRNPGMMFLADDNYMIRAIYAAATGAYPSSSILKKSRKDIEEELMLCLGHSNKDIPVPKIEMPEDVYQEQGNAVETHGEGKVSAPEAEQQLELHFKNLLLRALIRSELLAGKIAEEPGTMAR